MACALVAVLRFLLRVILLSQPSIPSLAYQNLLWVSPLWGAALSNACQGNYR